MGTEPIHDKKVIVFVVQSEQDYSVTVVVLVVLNGFCFSDFV